MREKNVSVTCHVMSGLVRDGVSIPWLLRARCTCYCRSDECCVILYVQFTCGNSYPLTVGMSAWVEVLSLRKHCGQLRGVRVAQVKSNPVHV